MPHSGNSRGAAAIHARSANHFSPEIISCQCVSFLAGRTLPLRETDRPLRVVSNILTCFYQTHKNMKDHKKAQNATTVTFCALYYAPKAQFTPRSGNSCNTVAIHAAQAANHFFPENAAVSTYRSLRAEPFRCAKRIGPYGRFPIFRIALVKHTKS